MDEAQSPLLSSIKYEQLSRSSHLTFGNEITTKQENEEISRLPFSAGSNTRGRCFEDALSAFRVPDYLLDDEDNNRFINFENAFTGRD